MLSFLKMSYSQSISEARQHARDPNDALSMRVHLLKVTPHGEWYLWVPIAHPRGITSPHPFHHSPHFPIISEAVRGCRGLGGRRVSRETFAVFTEPEIHSAMNLLIGRTLEDMQWVKDERRLPSSVRILRSRWKLGMTFGEFSNAAFLAFHWYAHLRQNRSSSLYWEITLSVVTMSPGIQRSKRAASASIRLCQKTLKVY